MGRVEWDVNPGVYEVLSPDLETVMRRNQPSSRGQESQNSSPSMVEALEGRTMMSVGGTPYVGDTVAITDGTSNTVMLLLPAVQKVREAAARIS